MEVEQCTRAQESSAQMQCLNVHALSEQFIEKVTGVRISQRAQKGEQLEGEHLGFKAHVRGWKMEIRKSRCQSLLQKSDSSLRQELCSYRRNGTKSKDVLLISQEWYPDYKPKYETPGWWYVPTEEILGRVCKKCNAFRELAEFTGTEWDRKNKASFRKWKPEHDRAGRRSGGKKMKISESEGKMIAREHKN